MNATVVNLKEPDMHFDQKHLTFDWIPVGKISVIWAEAQRGYSERNAKAIANDFDPDIFGSLTVTLA